MMRWIVLVLWIGTEASGSIMLKGFIKRGGLTDETLDPHYPATLFANFSLGSASVIPIVASLVTGGRALAWAAFAQLGAVVGIGTVLALPWHRARRRGRPTPLAGGEPAFRYNGIVEAGHGTLAWLTAISAGVAALRAR